MGELLALRWRNVDFDGSAIRVHGSASAGQLTTPKSGKVRSVPMVAEVGQALARLGQREVLVAGDDLVFPGADGGYLDSSALRRPYLGARARAGLRPLWFHDLRHTFGSLAINRASIVQVQHWMGHADIQTTMRYLDHKSRAGEAELRAGAFRSDQVQACKRTRSARRPRDAAKVLRSQPT
jgi:integrase